MMSNYNPITGARVDRFLRDATSAGGDGLLLVDLPPEEDEELCLPALKAGLNFIRLATPTTDDKRLPAVPANTSGLVSSVAITRITGAAAPARVPGGALSAVFQGRACPARQRRIAERGRRRWRVSSATRSCRWRSDS